MKKVFIIHGYGGEPNGGWRPWLMGKLAKIDVWSCALPMPMSDGPKKEDWIKEIQRAVGEPSKDVFLVGHSLGVPTILHYLQTPPEGRMIGGTLLVSGPIHTLIADKYRPIDHFMNTPFNFNHIKNVCKNFSIIHGKDDVVVSIAHAEELSKELSCPVIYIPNGGHLNGSSGWYELPEAFEALEKMLK